MIISPVVGFEYNNTAPPKEGIWAWSEVGQDAAITRGDLVAYDITTDNILVGGILQNTKGMRVVHNTSATAPNMAGFATSTSVSTTSFIASNRGAIIIIQKSGYMSYGRVTAAAANAAGSGWLVPHTVAGSTVWVAIGSITAPQAPTAVGYNIAATINGIQNQEIMIKGIL